LVNEVFTRSVNQVTDCIRCVQNIVCVWKNENGYWVDHPDAYNAQEGDTVTLVYDGDTYSGIVINWLDKYRLEVKLDAKLRRIA